MIIENGVRAGHAQSRNAANGSPEQRHEFRCEQRPSCGPFSRHRALSWLRTSVAEGPVNAPLHAKHQNNRTKPASVRRRSSDAYNWAESRVL